MILAILMAQALTCANAPDQMSADGCALEVFRRADAAMNAQWRLTLAAEHARDTGAATAPKPDPRPSFADALLASQRAWLQFRDAECEVEAYAARGGSLEPQLSSECAARLTRGRTKQLSAIARGLD